MVEGHQLVAKGHEPSAGALNLGRVVTQISSDLKDYLLIRREIELDL